MDSGIVAGLIVSTRTPDGRLSAKFRLKIIEAGLKQAERAGKATKFRSTLLRDEAGFANVVAELRLLAALGPLAATVDIELPGKVSEKNYDLHLAWAEGPELHLDSKRRDPTQELGSLLESRRLDIEELLRPRFSAFAWLSLRKNFHRPETALDVAVLVDECRRIAFEAPDSLIDAALDTVPAWIQSTAVTGILYHLLNQEREAQICKIEGVAALFDPEESTFWLDDHHARSVQLVSHNDEQGGIVVIPASETQSSLTMEARASLEDKTEFTKRNPESLAFRDLMSKALGQLPASPLNVIAVAVDFSCDFYDLELAVLGEPVRDEGNGGLRRAHGIVHDPAYEEIAGVLGFTVTPPDALAVVSSQQAARFFPNPLCKQQLAEELVDRVVRALCEGV